MEETDGRKVRSAFLMVAAAALSLAISPCVSAKKPVDPDAQRLVLLGKASHDMRSGHSQKAVQEFQAALQTADTIDKCVQIADATEPFGSALLSIRTACMQKAATLAKTRDEFLAVAQACRKVQCFSVERVAVESLLHDAKTSDELFDLARRAHSIAANDVAHQALEKVFANCRSVPDVLTFAKVANSVGADDLTHKAVKDLIDDETDSHDLIALLNAIEPFGLKDMNRYLLKKSLDVARSVEEDVEIADAARRYNESDIRAVAVYRAKKKKIMLEIQAEKDKAAQVHNPPPPANPEDKSSGF